jgi:hypothetical protein
VPSEVGSQDLLRIGFIGFIVFFGSWVPWPYRHYDKFSLGFLEVGAHNCWFSLCCRAASWPSK